MLKIKYYIYSSWIDLKNFITQTIYPLPRVLSIEETILKVKKTNLSICRFGDGEIDLTFGKSLNFQSYNPLLEKKLRHAMTSKKCLVCLPDIFDSKSFELITEKSKRFWKEHKKWYLCDYIKLFRGNVYGNAHISRFYIRYKDKDSTKKTVSLLKALWEDRDIIFIEGSESKLGIGNDLFDNAKSRKRILCPAKNAFNKYFEILDFALQLPANSLFILALGPTATCLASELAEYGRQALDLGHIDLEYEYFLRKATDVCFIDGKSCNEAALLSSNSQHATQGSLHQKAAEIYANEIMKSFIE